MDEGVSIQAALGKVIRAIGVKEFAEQAEMASPNVLRAINPRHNPRATVPAHLPCWPLGEQRDDWPVARRARCW